MPSNSVLLKTIVAVGVATLSASTICPSAWARGADPSAIDANHDGSISRDEAKAAAAKKFDAMDTKHTGKITRKQASAMSRAMGEMARHHKDHMIDKDEYMAGVDAAFKEADPKGSGVLDAAALKTKAGRHFLELVE